MFTNTLLRLTALLAFTICVTTRKLLLFLKCRRYVLNALDIIAVARSGDYETELMIEQIEN